MSSTTEDPTKYFRTSFAIKLESKEVFDAKLAELGLKGIGGLASFIVQQDGVVEALKPLAEQYAASKKVNGNKVRETAEKLKNMSAEQLDRLIALAQNP